ncbi:MAG: tRNA epoxyqueuosine(34) reductase QueG [Planctomycetes bacterium]|nr:tRNA epoxyqueuosine(34) reductase QueG [Planctomycetota bacterium]
MRSGHELFEVIGDLARQEGLETATALPLSEAGDDRLRQWLAMGHAAGMDWIGRYAEARIDPASAFAPYVSVVSVLVPHALDAPDPSPRIGNIARYALGDDYHEVLKAKLHRILDRLRELEPELQGRALVDTAPLLEKVAAARSGLGWQGKHTNLIREGKGSWFLLGEILIDRDLPSGSPAKDRCGICDACITACPTGAIVGPYQLDARLCISYLTIEERGPIPTKLRPLIGHRIFGCDDCQEVCPWNRFAADTPLEELRARPGLRDRSLREWMQLDLESWRATFRRSPVKRPKYEGFLRNVAVALGNSGDPLAIDTLRAVRGRVSPLVQEHIDWAIDRLTRGQLGQSPST